MKSKLALAGMIASGFCLQSARVNASVSSAYLSDLTGSSPAVASLSIGDKTFSDFTAAASGLSVFDTQSILVTASYDTTGVYYLTYSGNISFTSTSVGVADLALSYSVTASSGLISLVDQKYTGNVSGGTGAVTVSETITSTAPTATGYVYSDGSVGRFVIGEDNLIALDSPQSTITVTKDITFEIDADTATTATSVSLSEIQQSFHQVPEPTTASVLLLGAGMLALVVRKR